MSNITWKYIFGINMRPSLQIQQGQILIARNMSFLFIPLLIVFCIYNFYHQHIFLASIELLTSFTLALSSIFFWKKYQHIVPWVVGTAIFSLALIAFIDGGVRQTAFLWLVITPFIFFLILGQGLGWLIAGSLLLSTIILRSVLQLDVMYPNAQMFTISIIFIIQIALASLINIFRLERETKLIRHKDNAQQHADQIEDQANQAAQIWQNSIDCIAEPMLILDDHGSILYSNKAAKNIHSDIIQHSHLCCYQLLQEHCESCDTCPLKKAYQNKQAVEDSIFIPSTQQWFSVSVHPLESTSNSKALMTLKNITSKHKHEEVRNQELHYLQSMRHIANIITSSSDTQTILLNLLTAIRTVFHADRAWILSPCDPHADYFSVHLESTTDAYPGAFLDHTNIPTNVDTQALFQAALDSSDPITYPNMPDTEYVRTYSIQSQMILAIHSNTGKPWLLGIHQCSHATDWDSNQRKLFKDMSERLSDILDAWRLNETLERRTDQYRQLVENMPDAVIILQDECIVFANEVMLNFTEEDSSESIYGKNLIEFITPSTRMIAQQSFQAALNEHRQPICEFQIMQNTGLRIDIIACSMPIFYHGKAAVQIILKDVTLRKKLDRQLKKSLTKNRQQARQLINIQEQERLALAQNLHDDSGQLLTAISINLQSIKNYVDKESKALSRIEDSEMIVDRLFKSIRNSLKTLNPTHIDSLGLAAAMRSEIDIWSIRHSITTHINISDSIDFPCPETATAIFRVLQEALTNIAKHADPQQIWIQLNIDPASHYINLEIKDDGCGFDLKLAQNNHGYGLFGMQSRAELVSATLNICSQVGQGTSISALFPMHPQENHDRIKLC